MSKAKELVKNTGIIAIGNFSTRIISFFLLPLYTSILQPSEYGEYDFITVITTFLIPIITILMHEGMFRFLIDADDDEQKSKVISQTIIFISINTILFSILFYVILKLKGYRYSGYLIIYIISTIVFNTFMCITRGLGKIKLYSIMAFFNSMINIILNILFIVAMDLKVKGLILSYIISNLITGVIIFINLKLNQYISIKKHDSTLMRELLRYTFPLMPNSVSWSIINFSDRFVITTFLGTTANGIYSVANKFPNIINTLYGFFYISWTETSAKAVKDNDSKYFYSYIYSILSKFLISLNLFILTILPFIFNIFVDNNYNEAYKYIPLLVLSMYFANMSGFYGGIFSAYKNTRILGVTTILSAMLNFVVCIILIKPLGLYAGVISTLLSNFFVYLWRRITIKRYVRLSNDILYHFVATIVFMIIYWCYLSGNLLINLTGLLFVIIYSIIMNKDLACKIIYQVKRIILNRIKNFYE